MIQLDELAPEERTYLKSLLPGRNLQALAERMRQQLVARLGERVLVCSLPDGSARALPEGNEPDIKIDRELSSAWLAIRYGGTTETKSWDVRDATLLLPFASLIRRALAETVINMGDGAAWPEFMSLQVSIGLQQGKVEILWNSGLAMTWARRAIRGNA